MSTETTSVGNTEVTDTSSPTETSQAETVKTYTQQEVDNMIAGMKGALSKKLLKPYEELGDIDELRRVKEQAEAAQREQAVKRGEFEKVLSELAEKKDAEIRKRDQLIQEYRIDTPLVDAAARSRSVNPDQVRSLLRNQVRLNGDGEVEVIDATGQVRYTDSGTAMQVSDLVEEFLEKNPHFVQPTPATTNSRTSISHGIDKVDLSKLDMRNPEHRRLAKESMSNNS
jgi:hypothetical protein